MERWTIFPWKRDTFEQESFNRLPVVDQEAAEAEVIPVVAEDTDSDFRFLFQMMSRRT